MADANTLRRLALIRYLYGIGVDQSIKPEPLCSYAVLAFHDSVEMFLVLLADHLGVKDSDFRFMEYWDRLKPKVGTDLPQRETMRRLNSVRNALKHEGVLLPRIEVDSSREATRIFFQEVVPLVYGVPFDEISLLDLVAYDAVKKRLAEAQALAAKQDYTNALDEIAVAFVCLTEEYERGGREHIYPSPFDFGKELDTFHYSFEQRSSEEEYARDASETINALGRAVRILALGIDFRRYARFRQLTPSVDRYGGGRYHVVRVDTDRARTVEEFEYCLAFVIESALQLQSAQFPWKPLTTLGDGIVVRSMD